jgi:hypothetical protein
MTEFAFYLSPGNDNIASEMITHASDTLHDKLFELVRPIWRTENMSQDWYIALLIPIYKKGNRSEFAQHIKSFHIFC